MAYLILAQRKQFTIKDSLTVREASSGRRRAITGRGLEPRAQAAAVVFVVVYQLGNISAAVLVRQVELAADVLLNVIMFGLWVVSGGKINKHM